MAALPAVASLPGSIPTGIPGTLTAVTQAGALDAGLTGTIRASNALNAVDDPIKAVAQGTRSSRLMKFAGFLGKALPAIVVGVNTFRGATLVERQGPKALINTKEGRGATLGALGGALMLVPTPPTLIGAAGLLSLSAANEFDLLKRFDTF